MDTTPRTPCATTPNRRSTFAREAITDAFSGRAQSLAREPNFQDRRPDQGPVRLGEVVDHVVDETGRKALAYWLDEAARAETDEDRHAALEQAELIAKKAGIPLARFLFERRAA